MIYKYHPEQIVIERRESELDYPFADDTAEPEPRYCWRCERVTRQTRAVSGGAVWWCCGRCGETEREMRK